MTFQSYLIFRCSRLYNIGTVSSAIKNTLYFVCGQRKHLGNQSLVDRTYLGMGCADLVIWARDLMDLILVALLFPFHCKTFLCKQFLNELESLFHAQTLDLAGIFARKVLRDLAKQFCYYRSRHGFLHLIKKACDEPEVFGRKFLHAVFR